MACRLRPRIERDGCGIKRMAADTKTDYFNRLEWLYKCCMKGCDRIELSCVSMIFLDAERERETEREKFLDNQYMSEGQ